jgi:hypothetical protein
MSWLVSLDQPSQPPCSKLVCSVSTSGNDCTSTLRPRRSNSVATLPSVVVPAATQTTAPSMSSIEVNPESAPTIIPWPS